MNCIELRADGTNCRFSAWNGGPRCVSHAAGAGDVAAKAEMSARGHKGRAARDSRSKARGEATAAQIDLSTTEGMLAALELAARGVVRSKEAATSKANAIQRIVSTAAELLRLSELDAQNRELKTLLLERHPELKKHLKAVP